MAKLIGTQSDLLVGDASDEPIEEVCAMVSFNVSNDLLMEPDEAASQFSKSVYFKKADIREALRAEIEAYFESKSYELSQKQKDLFCSIWSKIDQEKKKKQLSKLEEEDDDMIKTLFNNTDAHGGSIDQESLAKELESGCYMLLPRSFAAKN